MLVGAECCPYKVLFLAAILLSLPLAGIDNGEYQTPPDTTSSIPARGCHFWLSILVLTTRGNLKVSESARQEAVAPWNLQENDFEIVPLIE